MLEMASNALINVEKFVTLNIASANNQRNSKDSDFLNGRNDVIKIPDFCHA